MVERLFTEEETAKILNMTPTMLAARRRAGKIGSYKDGDYIMFSDRHIEQFLKAHTRDGTNTEEVDSERLLRALERKLRSAKKP